MEQCVIFAMVLAVRHCIFIQKLKVGLPDLNTNVNLILSGFLVLLFFIPLFS